MQTAIRNINWHGFDALSLENSGVRVVLVPKTGGRIVSLFDKSCDREWLLSPDQSHSYQRLAYGADFNSNTSGGWDEMFPTILAGNYPVPGKFSDVALPDHGEVWTMPWSVEDTVGQVYLTVQGKALPYRLARSVTLAGDHDVCLSYELTNLCDDDLFYLWAAHPQFACAPGCRILLPPEVREVTNVLPLEWGEEWGPIGTINPWPVKVGSNGKIIRQDVVRSTQLKTGRKFYILPDQEVSWAALSDPESDTNLLMTWDTVSIPYFGVWIDEGALNQAASVAFEPSSGFFDDITLAWNNRRLSVLKPGDTNTWEINLTFNSLRS